MAEFAQNYQSGEYSNETADKLIKIAKRHAYPENILAVSVLSADFSRLGEEIAMIEEAGADYAHLDVMDGVFVPNITIGTPVIECLRAYSDMTFDVHLMITKPSKYIEAFAASGADLITFHVESNDNPDGVINLIRRAGKRVSMAVRPDTPIEAVYPYIGKLDMVLVMSVEPGFGQQKMIERCLDKSKALREYATPRGIPIDIQMDGGISGENISKVLKSGVNIVVVGSAIMGAADPKEAIRGMLGKMGRFPGVNK